MYNVVTERSGDDPAKPFVCNCGRRYKHKSRLRFHELRVRQGACLSLSVFVMYNVVTERSGDDPAKQFVCNCGRRYKHKSHLRFHMNYECGKVPAFLCQPLWCIMLLQKERSEGDPGKPFVCNCGRRYKHKGHLRFHMNYEKVGGDPGKRLSATGSPLQAQGPPAVSHELRVRQGACLSLLIFVIYNVVAERSEGDPERSEGDPERSEGDPERSEGDPGKPFVCNCGRRYKHKGHLRFHMNYECGKEPAFLCQFCPYKAHRKGTLQTHVALKHTDFL
ncbi:hypothetical protein J6590_014746 [Homalodisca vitripennis]|nr:hypothetical protein J6590_014746 [Homalodisca vitripennis]